MTPVFLEFSSNALMGAFRVRHILLSSVSHDHVGFRMAQRDQAATSLRCVWRLASRPDGRVQVLGAGLACCSLEVEAAVATGLLIRDEPVAADAPIADAPKATVLVVAGTITEALEPAVEGLHAELAQRGPVRVMSFGACATSGGPYWDAPTVAQGIRAIPVASYVPGCPPRPEALVAELERIVDSMAVT